MVDMLSCGELCVCVIRKEFNTTQPTLSHDMRGMVFSRGAGRKYSLILFFCPLTGCRGRKIVV